MTMPSLTGDGEYTLAMRKALNSSATTLTTVLRRTAAQAGWDDSTISKVSVEVQGSGLAIVIAPGYEEQVFNTEYGTSERTPRPAIRRFAESTTWHQALIQPVLKEVGL